jgi:RNA 2',3'-cyclic 3'-phosphodiesterase
VSRLICHRLFFALLPPPSSACEIERLSRRLGWGNRVRTEHFHVTLAITEDHEAPPIRLADRMMRIAGDLILASFLMTLDQLASSKRSLALRPHDKLWRLLLLQRQLERALALSGIRRRAGWRFSPHLTLVYRQGSPLFCPVTPITWWADELVLVHSRVGLTRHEILERWPLLSGDGARLAA